MKISKSFLVLSLFLPIFLIAAVAQAQTYVEGEVLVKLKEASSTESRAQIQSLQTFGLIHQTEIENTGYGVYHIPAPLQTLAAVDEIRKLAHVEAVQPNFIYYASALPNDPDLGRLWGVKNDGQTISAPTQSIDTPYSTNNPGTAGKDMALEKAWDHITDCSSVIVAVLDTGIQYNHQDLKANMWSGGTQYPKHGYNFVENNNDPMDTQGHGTHVAGTIGAVGNNGIGMSGVCWKTQLMAVRVLGTLGSGTTVSITAGINFAVNNNARVINMSLGGHGGGSDLIYKQALQNASDKGVALIVAAGNSALNNDDPNVADYPCAFNIPNLVCVAALDQSYDIANFSNFGATTVHVGAPGTNVHSAIPGRFQVFGKDTPPTGWTMSGDHNWTYDGSGNENLEYSNVAAGIARTERTITIPSGGNVLILSLSARFNVDNTDLFSIYLNSNGSNPFSGTILENGYGNTGVDGINRSYLVPQCMGRTCALGFEAKKNSNAPTTMEIEVVNPKFKMLTYTINNYSIFNGTSMATPHVAGLAAMLFAFNPEYKAADVVESIKVSGDDVAALSGKTTTGKAANAFNALKYIQTPSNIRAR